ncbi:MAG: hypothetical protein FJW23_09300 [Acidimicrobiia bacterium]|nr:hypothetical protein [Acidimicrobiia bacterium]
MSSVRSTSVLFAAASVLSMLQAFLSAHNVSYIGTVVELKTASYARPAGGTRDVLELEVAIVNPTTKKVATRVFTLNEKTKVSRAGTPVQAAGLSAKRGEKVTVVTNHDVPGYIAVEVRFDGG